MMFMPDTNRFLPFFRTSFQDLVHLRMTLELGCAERAIKNVTDEDIKQLHALCEKIQSLGSYPDEKSKCIVNDADMEFHTKIMKLSKNTLINSLIPLVVEFFAQQFRKSAASPIESTSGYHEHFEMVDALKHKNLYQLITLIRSHLNTYMETYNT